MQYVPDEYDKEWLAGHGGFPEDGFNPDSPSYDARMVWRKAQGNRGADASISNRVVIGIVVVIVGLLTLYFAGGLNGLLNSKP